MRLVLNDLPYINWLAIELEAFSRHRKLKLLEFVLINEGVRGSRGSREHSMGQSHLVHFGGGGGGGG